MAYEGDLPADVLDALRKRGHKLKVRDHITSVNLLVRGAHGIDFVGRDKAQDVSQTREGFRVPVAHAEAATDGDVVAQKLAGFDDGDEAQILREDVDVVGRRQGERRLEFARQIERAVKRLLLGFTTSHELFVQPDFVIRTRAGQRKLAPAAGMIVNLLQNRGALGIGRGHDVAIDVAAGSNGIEQHFMHALDQRFDVALEDPVKLKGLTRRQAQRR